MVSLEIEGEDEIRRHAIADDVIEAMEEIDQCEDYLSETHAVHFDPTAFADAHPDLELAAFQLSEEDLE